MPSQDGWRRRAVRYAATAVIAYVLQYHFFVTDGLFYALAGVSIVRPLIERFDRARAYQWGDAPEELKPVFRFAKARRLPAPAE